MSNGIVQGKKVDLGWINLGPAAMILQDALTECEWVIGITCYILPDKRDAEQLAWLHAAARSEWKALLNRLEELDSGIEVSFDWAVKRAMEVARMRGKAEQLVNMALRDD